MKKVLILGINGMDGSYLADILLDAGYEIHGLVRRNSQPNLWRIQHILDKITIHQGDLLDPISIRNVIHSVLPDEIYNEADQDHVGYSHATPSYSASVTYGAVANILELIKGFKGKSQIKLFQPLSATMFGNAPAPQTLETPFSPQSPYACAKVAVYYLCKHYREKYGVFVSTAILYNHDSVRRQGDYLLHKIAKGAIAIARGEQNSFTLTNPSMCVDIGCAKEYMSAAYRLMQLSQPHNILLSSTDPVAIADLVEEAFHTVGANLNRFHPTEDKNTTELIGIPAFAKYLVNFMPSRSGIELVHEITEYYWSKQ